MSEGERVPPQMLGLPVVTTVESVNSDLKFNLSNKSNKTVSLAALGNAAILAYINEHMPEIAASLDRIAKINPELPKDGDLKVEQPVTVPSGGTTGTYRASIWLGGAWRQIYPASTIAGSQFVVEYDVVGAHQFHLPANMTTVKIAFVGAGGGGAGAEDLGNRTNGSGGGSGGLGMLELTGKKHIAIDLSIGAGGYGGASNAGAASKGGNGGATSVTYQGATYTAGGGFGGSSTSGGYSPGPGGGAALGGSVGADGSVSPAYDGGNGGASYFAAGGKGGVYRSTWNGSPGSKGSGGGGATGSHDSQIYGTGAKGGDGYVAVMLDASYLEFRASGAYKIRIPNGVTKIEVTVIGGGAGAGSTAAPASGGAIKQGKGGGSAPTVRQVYNVVPKQDFLLVVGEGGLGGSGNGAGADGADGTASQFKSSTGQVLLFSNGGKGGQSGANPDPQPGVGGVGSYGEVGNSGSGTNGGSSSLSAGGTNGGIGALGSGGGAPSSTAVAAPGGAGGSGYIKIDFVPSSTPVTKAVYNRTGTYQLVVPTNVTRLKMNATAGGGSGGSIWDTAGATDEGSAGGGSSGQMVTDYQFNVSPGDVLEVTVGAGGAYGPVDGSTGNGTPTTVKNLTTNATIITLLGGIGGRGAPGSDRNYTLPGGIVPGYVSPITGFNGSAGTAAKGGNGAQGLFGVAGGVGKTTASSVNTTTYGGSAPANAYGAGGGGGATNNTNGGASLGGKGGVGYCELSWS